MIKLFLIFMNIFNVALFSAEYDVGDVVDFDDQDIYNPY